jgi:two-component system chemotaxis response regulator CheY
MPYNILIVDDSGTMRNVIKKVLKLSGFKVGECLEANNGKEALDLLEDHWVDLILSDVHMPVMDGLGLLRALRQKEEWNNVPVVLITTEANEARLNEAVLLGAKGYIRKPFTPDVIQSVLSKVMGESDESGTEVSEADDGCDF